MHVYNKLSEQMREKSPSFGNAIWHGIDYIHPSIIYRHQDQELDGYRGLFSNLLSAYSPTYLPTYLQMAT